MDKKQIFDIHLEFDSSGQLEKMVIIEEGGNEINVPLGQSVGFNRDYAFDKGCLRC